MTEKFASSKFSDFTNVQELYRSQAGAVFRALFKYDHKEYVLKERKLPKLGNTKDIMNEVKLLAQLDHSNVIRCEGWFRDEGRQSIFIVLEFCAGGDLNGVIVKRRAERKYLEEDQIWGIFYQLCLGLKHLHEHGIIHRDLKPLNVFCSSSGNTYKIGDLGVSRQVSEDTMLLKSFYGTPLYLSPELVDNKPYNEKTDIWSLGVILYELCALQPPFKGNTLLDVAKLVSQGKYAPLPGHYSPHVSKCVAWMLNLDFSKRPNVAQLLAFVEARMPVAEQRSRHTGKGKGKPRHAKERVAAVDVPAQELGEEDSAGAGDEGGGDSDDTRDTAMDDDSLEGDARAVHSRASKPRYQGGVHAGKASSHRAGPNPAGVEGSDTDSDTTLPDLSGYGVRGEEEVLRPFNRRARDEGDQGGAPIPAAQKQDSRRGREKEHATDKPVEVPVFFEVPAPRRQNIRELRLERAASAPPGDLGVPEHSDNPSDTHNGRGRAPKQQPPASTAVAEVQVQVDCQRVQVLLRRELTALRKLLQVRDFVALKANGENDTDLLDQNQEEGREGALQGELSVVDRIKVAQRNALVLETALNRNGLMSLADAIRFKLHSKQNSEPVESMDHVNGADIAVAQNNPPAKPVVTKLPHRPGEEAALGLDINADRAGHSRHLINPHYFPSEPGAHRDYIGAPAHPSRQRDQGGDGTAPALRRSPPRKQVPQQSAQLLAYDDDNRSVASQHSEDYRSKRDNRARNPPPATAGASEIGGFSQSPQAAHQPLIAHKQGLFQAEIVKAVPVPERRPSTASSALRRQQQVAPATAVPTKQSPAAPAVEEQEYRIFDERSDRRRPGAAGAPRSRAPLPDENGARKEKFLAMWENQQQAQAQGGLGLPSMRAESPKMRGPRPKSAMSRLLEPGGAAPAVFADHFAGAAVKRVEPPDNASAKGKERDLVQYQDIMHSCRDIADNKRRPVHRRQKSDVTNPSYVLPPPPSSPPQQAGNRGSGHPRAVAPVNGGPPRGAYQQIAQYPQEEHFDVPSGGPGNKKKVSMAEVRVQTAIAPAEDPYDGAGADAFGAAEPYQQQQVGNGAVGKEIRLRGVGRRGDGEMLPAQSRNNKDSAYKIICGT